MSIGEQDFVDVPAEEVRVETGGVVGAIGQLDQVAMIGKLLDKLSDARPAINLKEVLADDHAMQKAVEEAERLRRFVILLTRGGNPVTHKGSDWIDYKDVPFLWSPGADRIIGKLGITILYNGEPSVSNYYDKQGNEQWQAISQAVGFHRDFGITMSIGIRTTEKSFFEQNEKANVAMSAMQAAKRRVISAMFGLSNLTWEYLESVNKDIKKEYATKVEFKEGSKGGSMAGTWEQKETADRAEDIRLMLLELKGGDPQEAAKSLEKLTTFEVEDQKSQSGMRTVHGKSDVQKLTEKQVYKVYKEVAEIYKKKMGADFKRGAE